MLTGLYLLHFVGMVLLSAGVVLGSLAGAMGRKTKVVAEHTVLLKLLARGGMFSGLGGLLSLLSGFGLVSAIGLKHSTPWVMGAFVVWLLSFTLAQVSLRPYGAVIGRALAQATASGVAESDALPALYAAGRLKLTLRGHEVLFLVMILLMVFKPGA